MKRSDFFSFFGLGSIENESPSRNSWTLRLGLKQKDIQKYQILTGNSNMENIEVQRFYLFFHDLSFLLQSSSLADQTIQYIVLRINLISGGNVPAVVAKTHQVNEKIYCGHSRDMSQERPRAAQPIVDRSCVLFKIAYIKAMQESSLRGNQPLFCKYCFPALVCCVQCVHKSWAEVSQKNRSLYRLQ